MLWERYFLAPVLIAAAMIICTVLIPGLRETPYVIFYPAVIISALYGGFWPGMTALVLAGIGASTWFGPAAPVQFDIPGTTAGMLVFLTGGAVIVAICAQLRGAKQRIGAEAKRLRESERTLSAEISARSRAEAALKESETYLNAIIENAPACIKLVAADGTLLKMNSAGLGIIGAASFEQVQGKSIYNLVASQDRAGFTKLTRDVFENKPGSLEFEAISLDGRQLWLNTHAVPLYNSEGNITALLGITVDVTERRAIETALRDSQARLEGIASTAFDAVVLIDNEGNISFWNDSATRMFGYSRAEMLGRNLHSYLMPERYGDAFKKGFADFRRTGKGALIGTVYEVEARRKDGTEFPVELSLAALKLKDEWCAIGIIRDRTDRKRVEDALRRSEELLRVSAMAADIGMWHWTPGTSTVEVTANWRKLFGIDPAAGVTFETWSNALDPDDRARAVSELNRASEEHGEFDTEYRVVRPDGSLRWLVDRGRAWYDEQGRPVGMAGVNIDITDRKRAEEALRESEGQLKHALQEAEQAKEFYRVMGEALPYGVWMSRPDGEARYVSQSFLDLLEMNMDEVKRFGWTRRLPPEDVEPMLERWRHCLRTGEPWDEVHRVYGPDKNLHFVLTRGLPVRDSNEKIVAWVGIHLDIDDRKRMENALRASEERYRMLFTNMSEGFALGEPILDDGSATDFRLVEINHAFERLTGLTSAILGRPLSEVLPDLEPSWIRTYGRVAQTGESVTFENFNKDTGRHYEVFAYSPFKGKFAAIFTDVTKRKQAEEERERLIGELKRSNGELEQFAYVASHDLQEPLRMVASYVTLLQRRYRERLDEKADEYIHFAVDGAQRMQTLIEGLLAYSRIGRRGAEFKVVDLNAVFSAAVSNLSVLIGESGALITKDDLPLMCGDETQLVQLFQNLIGNGIKYIRKDVRPQVHVAARADGRSCRFSVKDNGIGIEARFFERIFQIFQRLHTRDEYSGTGIGLALCKRIVERHQGRIWVESAPGQGSTFFFTLPVKTAASRARDCREAGICKA